MSLTVKDIFVKAMSKKYTGTPSMRGYWRLKKREQRAKERKKNQDAKRVNNRAVSKRKTERRRDRKPKQRISLFS
jgi:hypothetical protein